MDKRLLIKEINNKNKIFKMKNKNKMSRSMNKMPRIKKTVSNKMMSKQRILKMVLMNKKLKNKSK